MGILNSVLKTFVGDKNKGSRQNPTLGQAN